MKGLSAIVKTVSRYTAGPLIIFGVYLFTHAEHSHGVGFAGGLIIALTVTMLILAFGRVRVENTLSSSHAMTAAGFFLLAMVITMAAMMYMGSVWFPTPAFVSLYPLLIQLLNIFLCLTTAFAFIYTFYVLLRGK
ncbi:MAG: MnhB domain-containing protein [Endomicrobiales bacterium]